MWKFGHPVINYGPENEGGAGGAGGDHGQGGAGGTPPPQGSVAPWAAGGDGPWAIGDKPWWDTIGEQPVRELMQQKAYKNPGELALAYHNLNKLTSSTRPTVPAEDAPPETWNSFYKTLGRPDNPADYKIAPPEGSGLTYDNSMVDFGRNLSHKLGLNQKQVETILVPAWNEYVGKANQQVAEMETTANNEAIAKIQKEWGGEANVNANLAAGKRAVQGLGLSNEDIAAVEKSIGAAPLVNLLVKLGSKFSDSGMNGAPINDGPGVGMPANIAAMTPQQAAAELTRLETDQTFQKSYWGRNEPGHDAAVEKKMQLAMKAGSLYGG